MRGRGIAAIAGIGLAALFQGGCAAQSDSDVAAFTFFGSPRTAPGRPVDVYTRVARGLKACWFTPGQPLHEGYLFAADVKPESKGGAATIVIYEETLDKRRGLRAFAMSITPTAGSPGESQFGLENARIAEPAGARLVTDVERWAGGETSCAPEAGQWQPADPSLPEAQPDEPTNKKKKAKKKLTASL